MEKAKNVEVKKVTSDEWVAEGVSLFGKNKSKWKFVCPSCGHVQTPEDMKAVGAEDYQAFFSCIGRFKESKGTIFNKKSPCNYTNGGFFNLSIVRVDEGSVFDFYREDKSEVKGGD